MLRLQLISLIAILFAPLLVGEAESSMGEYDVKAMFVHKFTKYITWPGFEQATKFQIGILGESEIKDPLTVIANKETVNGKPIVLKYWETVEEIENCHILFIARNRKLDLEAVMNQVGERPILTIGELKGYAHKGVGINFFMKENNVRFEMNLASLSSAKLTASSQLLKLAVLVENE